MDRNFTIKLDTNLWGNQCINTDSSIILKLPIDVWGYLKKETEKVLWSMHMRQRLF